MSTRSRSVALAALLLAGSATPAVAAAPAPTSRLEVHAADPTLWFSPNGDGRRDRARVRFSLDRAADVSVLVKHGQDVVRGPVRLGRLDAGRHAWTWDGRRASGPTVKDGTFAVVVRAESRGERDLAVTTTYVDRVADAGRLVASRPTVYPKASIVSDRVGLTYLREGWSADEAEQPTQNHPDRASLTVEARILDSSGRVVWRQPSGQDGRALTFGGLFWYARGPGGEPVAAGRYQARVRVTDAAGNVSRYGVPVTVSHQQLRRETWTSTVPAASATRYVPAGCGDLCAGGCTPVPSERFPGGLSFRSCTADPSKGTRAWFTAVAPVVAAPADSYRISATGGPTTPGGDDLGILSGYQLLGPGDMTAGTPWLPVDLDKAPYLPDRQTSVQWGFSTYGDHAYDVGSFTIEYRYYVPEA